MTLIENAVIVTMNDSGDIVHGSLLVERDQIAAMGKVRLPRHRRVRRVDAAGMAVLPGFVQTHVHLCQTLFRNQAEDLPLLDWLRQKIWPMEAAHTERSMGVSARLGLAELIRGGTTSILDMGSVHHTDAIFDAIAESGIRAWSGKAMMDDCPGAPKGLAETTAWSFREAERLHRDWHDQQDRRIAYAMAPRFVLSTSESLLHQIREFSASSGCLVHTHASENSAETTVVRERLGVGNIEYFHRLGLTGPRLCVAHCIWVSDHEMTILAETGTRVLHCPSSNLKLGSGIARIPEMLRQGICVSLGADGAPCNNNLDMFVEMRLAGLIQKPRLGADALRAEEILRMATRGGAAALGAEDRIGSLEIGKKADLMLLDVSGLHSQPGGNLYTQIVYASRCEDVHSVMIDGHWVLRQRALRSMDEENLKRQTAREWQKLKERLN